MSKELSYKSKTRKRVVYATKARMAKVNPKNIREYQRYLKSNVVKNRDVANTTYKVYESNFNIFLCYIMEEWDNFYVLDQDILNEEMIDIMESYIAFAQDELGNNKKTINNKIAAVSSFYMWAAKRRKIQSHPFEGKLDRMKNANEEKIIAEYFLKDYEVEEIVERLSEVDEGDREYDKQDQIMWHIAYDSACRIGALSGLGLDNLDLENNRFTGIREKRGKIVSVPFTNETGELIRQFLEQREALGVDCNELFYVRHENAWKGMSKQSIYNRVVKIGHIVGLGDFRPHCIRKTRLNNVAKFDINLAKTLGNHESLDTTSKFYTEEADQTDTLNNIIALEKKGKKQT